MLPTSHQHWGDVTNITPALGRCYQHHTSTGAMLPTSHQHWSDVTNITPALGQRLVFAGYLPANTRRCPNVGFMLNMNMNPTLGQSIVCHQYLFGRFYTLHNLFIVEGEVLMLTIYHVYIVHIYCEYCMHIIHNLNDKHPTPQKFEHILHT